MIKSTRTNLATAAFLAGLVFALGWVWTAGERVLGNDSFYYLQYAKDFQQTWPRYFGSYWPFGYPLLGAILSATGLSAYFSMLGVAAIAYFSIFFIFLQAADREQIAAAPARWLLLAAACAPVVPIQGIGVMSEPLFSAMLFAFAYALSRWPSTTAIFASGFLANGAFATRYVGVFALGVLGIASLVAWYQSRDSKVRWALFVNLALAGTICLLFCAANYLHHGKITGPQPVGSENILTWPAHFARFGWSLVGAFSSGQILKHLGGVENPVMFAVGFLVSASALVLCGAAWRCRRTRPFAAWVGVVSAIYILAIVTMRSTTVFDSVENPRTSEPALFGLVYIAASFFGRWKLVPFVCAASIVLSLVFAWRGMSLEIVPNAASARAYLTEHLQPGDVVSVNPQGRRLAAYFPNNFIAGDLRFPDLVPWRPEAADYSVMVWSRDPVKANDEQLMWSAAISQQLDAGLLEYAMKDESAVILRRLSQP